MRQTGVSAVITIMLALIVKGALQSTFTPLFDGHHTWSHLFWLPVLQLAVFFLLILRFYLGALRFGATEPKRINFFVQAFNFGFAFLVFSVFYVSALSVARPEFFYVEMIILHLVDAAWFGILYGFSHLKFVPEADLENGELPIESVREIMVKYFFFSIITAAVGIIVVGGLALLPDYYTIILQGAFLFFLLLISIVDFWALHSYYFSFDEWCRERAITK